MAFVSFLRRLAAPLLMSTALVACSAADGLAPSARFDDRDLVGSVEPVQPVGRQRIERQTAYAVDGGPVTAVDALDSGYSGGNTSAGETSALQPVSGDTTEMDRQPRSDGKRLPMIDSDEALAGNGADTGMGVQSLQVPEGGVNMDAELGVDPGAAQPVVGLAQEQAVQIAEGNATQPVVDGIGSDAPVQVSMPETAESLPETEVQQQVGRQSDWNDQPVTNRRKRLAPVVVEEEEQQVAFLPRAENPTIERQSPGVLPASERSCRAELKRMGVVFSDIPPISKGAACGIPYPIELRGLSGGIGVRPATKLNCQLTLAFAKWVKNELAPAARYRYLSGVKTIVPLGGYSCRRMNSSSRNPWSEHAHGNAIDVGKFILKNGKEIDVRKKGFFAFREKALLKAVRTDSCKYFHTVLGPGSDPQHKDHFHFDLRGRKSGYRHCD